MFRLLAGCSFLFLHCTGSYVGVDGPDVVTREEAVQRMVRARLLRVIHCDRREREDQEMYAIQIQATRKTLDGAFYHREDLAECEKQILITPCEAILDRCRMSPKEIWKGEFLQGGL
ncbi:MAG: hypothetical protein HS115_20305 [Spirochaetales bacterium]|nr:hypothetical protein [Spirochaetales bacterium]